MGKKRAKGLWALEPVIPEERGFWCAELKFSPPRCNIGWTCMETLADGDGGLVKEAEGGIQGLGSLKHDIQRGGSY